MPARRHGAPEDHQLSSAPAPTYPVDADGWDPRLPLRSSFTHAGYLDAVARAAGGSLAGAVRVGVYLSDLADFDEINEEYVRHFEQPLPARTTIQSDLVAFDVEIDAVVWLGS